MANPFVTQLGPGLDRHRDPRSAWTVGANLLVATLLLAGAVPFNNARAQPLPAQHPSHRLSANADTSKGIPKTLFSDAVSPTFNQPWRPSQSPQRLLTDTSRGIPATLTAAAPAPTFNAQFLAPLLRVATQDTSQSTPKVLYADAAAAFVNLPQPAPERARGVTDTSSFLIPSGAVPFGNAPGPSVARTSILSETSYGTPKVLYADAASPFFNPPQMAPDRVRPVADTSSFQLPPATPIANAPIFSVVALPPPVADTSQSVPKALFADDATPAFNPAHLRLDWPGQVVDTSQGMAQALFPVQVVNPFTNIFLSQLDLPRLGPDTSYGIPTVLLPVVPVKKPVFGGKQHFGRVEQDNKELMEIAVLVATLLEGPWAR